MSESKRETDHQAELPGTHDEQKPSAFTEHRDTAGGNAQQRNELTPEEQNGREPQGPTTHQDTRIDRKAGDSGT